ncbi:MAG: 50S ribosomal protein L29 [Candidatus Omnitrophica bacterium]|nr:50S ribosomal protein L29 [Candidatus Omnitrophota bacterium]
MLKVSDLRNLSRQELEDKIIALKKSLFEMISQKETGRIEKPSGIKQTRRDIARIETILSEMKQRKDK